MTWTRGESMDSPSVHSGRYRRVNGLRCVAGSEKKRTGLSILSQYCLTLPDDAPRLRALPLRLSRGGALEVSLNCDCSWDALCAARCGAGMGRLRDKRFHSHLGLVGSGSMERRARGLIG